MAVKSQIDIAVDSKEFLEFKDKFDAYSVALAKAPRAWQEAVRATGATKTNFESIADSMRVVGGSLAAITVSGKEFYQVTTATARYWHNLTLSTASAAKNIAGMTESLLKWSGIISLVTGGAGLFGFDRLAHSVASGRMAALGTGGDLGARKAFITNFRRFGDPEGLLGRAAEAQTDIQQRVPLQILGLTKEDLKGDPADVAIKALLAGAKRASADKASGLPVGSDPVLQFFTNAEKVRLRDRPEEVQERVDQMRKDQASKRFYLGPEEQKSAQDFVTKMEAAGNEIETVFVKGTVKLASPIGHLSDSVVKLVKNFTEEALPGLIKDLGKGIDWLAIEVAKPSFVENVENIARMIGDVASFFGTLLGGLSRFSRWLGIPSGIGATPDPGGGGATGKGYGAHGADSNITTGPPADRGASPPWTGSVEATPRQQNGAGGSGTSPSATKTSGKAQGNIQAALAATKDQLRKEGVPEQNINAAAEALVGNELAESGLDPSKVHDHGTGYGIYGARLERRTGMFDWLSAHGFAKNSLEGQARQAAHSVMTDPAYKASREALRNATDANVAGDVVERNFEAPYRNNNRHPAIQQAHRANVSINATPGGNTSLGSGAAAAGSP